MKYDLYKDTAWTYIIVPAYKATKNLETLINSVKEQTYTHWRMIIACDDCSETYLEATKFAQADKIHVLGPSPDGRLYALRNIDRAIEYIQEIDRYWVRSYVAIIDGDDQLCNPNTLTLIENEYGWNPDVVWTAHKWDNGHGNISERLPDDVNPYNYRWVSSHLKTFIWNRIP